MDKNDHITNLEFVLIHIIGLFCQFIRIKMSGYVFSILVVDDNHNMLDIPRGV